MARLPRFLTLSEVNHIMLRGIGHMNLFFQDEDYRQFINILKRFHTNDHISILSYCLMNNHVHLLIKASPKDIPLFFKRIEVSYAFYFNNVHHHTGHLFQNRYKSEAILNDAYYLMALRYILLNPEAAGICKWEYYRWSSAHCFLTGKDDGLTDLSTVIELAGGVNFFRRFIKEDIKRTVITEGNREFRLAEPENHYKMIPDDAALTVVRRISGLEHPTEIQALERDPRDAILADLKRTGLTIRQLERITGINRNVIQRAK